MSSHPTILLIKKIKKSSHYLLLAILVFIVLAEISVLLANQLTFNHEAIRNTTDLKEVCLKKTQTTSKLMCWEDLMDQTLKQEGLDQAFVLMDTLFQTESSFAAECHGFVHKLGEKAYSLFSTNQQFNLSPKTSYCGYGFYHGFMETLLTKGGDLKQAGQFCDWAAKQVEGKNDIKGACFHGIGHGITEDHDRKFWPHENELVDKPLDICEQVAPDEYMTDRCSSGVFNVMAIKYTSGSLPQNKQDPLRYCKLQQKHYLKKPCFEEMNTMLISISQNDFIKAAKFLDGIESEYAIQAIRSLASVVGVKSQKDSFSTQITNCRNISTRLHLGCIKGFVGGLIESQIPDLQEAEALSFCSHPILQEDERISCYQEALWLLSVYLPSQNYKRFCANIDAKYRQFCQT